MLEITADERRALRARAHGINPVVSIAQKGLTEGVLKEIDVALSHHELIKVRVYNDDRGQRDGYLADICNQLGAAAVQHIGKLLVLWRPLSEEQRAALAKKATVRRRPARRTKRSFQGASRKD